MRLTTEYWVPISWDRLTCYQTWWGWLAWSEGSSSSRAAGWGWATRTSCWPAGHPASASLSPSPRCISSHRISSPRTPRTQARSLGRGRPGGQSAVRQSPPQSWPGRMISSIVLVAACGHCSEVTGASSGSGGRRGGWGPVTGVVLLPPGWNGRSEETEVWWMACWASSWGCEVVLTECEVESEDGNLPSRAPRGSEIIYCW